MENKIKVWKSCFEGKPPSLVIPNIDRERVRDKNKEKEEKKIYKERKRIADDVLQNFKSAMQESEEQVYESEKLEKMEKSESKLSRLYPNNFGFMLTNMIILCGFFSIPALSILGFYFYIQNT